MPPKQHLIQALKRLMPALEFDVVLYHGYPAIVVNAKDMDGTVSGLIDVAIKSVYQGAYVVGPRETMPADAENYP